MTTPLKSAVAVPAALLLAALLPAAAQATAGFDPTAPAARFDGEEIYTQDGALLLWSAIERLDDPDRTLMVQEDFTAAISWPREADYAPWIADCFGDETPGAWSVLLHMARAEGTADGTPILLVPGAGDNASRGFITMATRLNNNTGRPVYALTFAHPHGDVFRQAEALANAIARIKARTGAAQVDLVSHSKGGIAAAVYLSNHSGADWGREDYEGVGTRYRGDVRKAIFVATPLGGIDTAYRWPLSNYAALDVDTAISPSSWETYYPYTTANWVVTTDLREQDFLAEQGDPFPGQRQLLARWDDTYDLPGEQPALGAYALQTDWYTTYYGGLGYYTDSEGIDAAIAEGDDVLGALARNGVDPDVRLYVLAGSSPLMPNGLEDYLAGSWVSTLFGEAWVDITIAGTEVWGAFVAELVGEGILSGSYSSAEIKALAQGKLVLGEISGESDGLVFVESATQTRTLTGRGAPVEDVHVANLSHLDLLYASDITGALLVDAGEADPVSDGWMVSVGQRYTEENSLLWIEEALAEDADTGSPDDDTGTTGDDTGPAGDDTGTDGTPDGEDDPGTKGGCGACSASPSGAGALGGWALLLGVLATARRRRAED